MIKCAGIPKAESFCGCPFCSIYKRNVVYYYKIAKNVGGDVRDETE